MQLCTRGGVYWCIFWLQCLKGVKLINFCIFSCQRIGFSVYACCMFIIYICVSTHTRKITICVRASPYRYGIPYSYGSYWAPSQMISHPHDWIRVTGAKLGFNLCLYQKLNWGGDDEMRVSKIQQHQNLKVKTKGGIKQ